MIQEIQGIAAGTCKNFPRVEPFGLHEHDMLVSPRMVKWDLSGVSAQVVFFLKVIYPMSVTASGQESGIPMSDFMAPSHHRYTAT